ncbi:DNA adenine methylase [Stenotrophomonas sp. SPM]|uniref:DNA adenine methylase n=1 Tax=Stenotrophomonas sp. SPM TaxID=2170735 RepID=UPI00140233EF|nr:DNA adenine methylase [Stenotrophomonas sp. SPM]
MQLSPLWIDAGLKESEASAIGDIERSQWSLLNFDQYYLYSDSSSIAAEIKASRSRRAEIQDGRGVIFSRSANYMGSKASLSGEVIDVLSACWSGGVFIDLMAGSGAVSGAVSRFYPVIASDAQSFSRCLAKVQGGGLGRSRAIELAGFVIDIARNRYAALSEKYADKILMEDMAANSEIDSHSAREFLADAIQDNLDWTAMRKGDFDSVSGAWAEGHLISQVYGGLYFGWRQSVELDCLRQAINEIACQREKEWALGALICAASACAFTYAGHFAQPRFDVSNPLVAQKNLAALLRQRLASVTHEFYARLTSLAEESEGVKQEIDTVPGPWRSAVERMPTASYEGTPCLYLDPPYTRDEYSRYYHVLEVISKYSPVAVTGKARMPKRGGGLRFASVFGARSSRESEAEISEILKTCARSGWDCLWSYSSSGLGDVKRIVDEASLDFEKIDIFASNYVYRGQGRAPDKRVKEYMLYFKAAGR